MTSAAQALGMLREYVEQRFGSAAMECVDGGTATAPRHDAVTRFNSPGAASFLFLSVTRCCGLGTHLPTVTSVVLYDSDWDPRADVQVPPSSHTQTQRLRIMVEPSSYDLHRAGVHAMLIQ